MSLENNTSSQKKSSEKKYSAVTEISLPKKKRFFLYLLIYTVGFLILTSIGEKMNDNPYLFRAFLSPLLVLVGIVLITFNFYRNDL